MKKFLVSLLIFTAAILAQPALVLAQAPIGGGAATPPVPTPQEQACIGSGGTYSTPGVAGGECKSATGAKLLGKDSLVSAIINTLLIIIGAASVIMMIIGGLRYILSNGDQNAVTAAKNTILYSAIGLIVALMAYAITTFLVNALA